MHALCAVKSTLAYSYNWVGVYFIRTIRPLSIYIPLGAFMRHDAPDVVHQCILLFIDEYTDALTIGKFIHRIFATKDANIRWASETPAPLQATAIETIYNVSVCLLHDDTCVLNLLSLFGKRDVVDTRSHAVCSHGY